MERLWRDVYCAKVTCKDAGGIKLKALDEFAEKYQFKGSGESFVKKLRKLMSDPMTGDSVPWIEKLLDDFWSEVGSERFKLKDLSDVAEILQFLAWKAREVPEYQEHLDKLLEICGHPPQLEKSSDVLHCSEIVEHYLTHLGYLVILLPTSREISKLLRSLHELLTRSKSKDASVLKLEYLQKAAEKSQLPVLLAHVVDICPPEVLKFLLDVIYDLVVNSHQSCHRMLEEGILQSLLANLENHFDKFERENNKRELSIIIRILWILMKSMTSSKTPLSARLRSLAPSRQLTEHLQSVFMTAVNHPSSRNHFIKLRNDITILILAGLKAMPLWDILSCGLAADIIALLKSHNLPSTEDDVIFTKTLLAILCHLADYHFCIFMMKKEETIRAILELLDIDEKSKLSVRFPCHLIACVLKTLGVLVPKLSEDFIQFQGSAKLLTILERHIGLDLNSKIAEISLRTIVLLVYSEKIELLNDFKSAGVLDLFFRFINKIIDLNELTMRDQRVLTLLLITTEHILQKDCSSNQKDQILQILLKLLRRFLNRCETDFMIDDRLTIAVASHVWTCIVHCPRTLNKFIAEGGTYLILDNLEKSTIPAQTVFLGILSDMCIESYCISHLCTWKGVDKSKGLFSLLAKLWREEESRIGVKRTSHGCIEDVELPLMGKTQWRNSFYTKGIDHYSPTLEAWLASVRPKIYSIRKQILANSEVYERVKNHYKVLPEVLPSEDSITFCIIDQFFRFTQGQVWGEVLRYLKQKGVNPLGADGELLLVMCQRHRECGVYVRECQEKILRKQNQLEVQKEVEQLDRIRDAKLTCAMRAVKTLELMRRTADRDYRMERVKQQRFVVNKCLKFPEGANPDDCHRTYPENWNVTTILEKHHKLQKFEPQKSEGAAQISPASSTTTISHDFFEDIEY